MAGKVISTGNKDLSCLRCRKKKAKCSKTRPTCTRCSRSNQPCEYPDAPPNLTDLSQKVLTLYDTLKELEGEFLVKYMQTMDEDTQTIERELKDPLPQLQLQPTHQFDVDTKSVIDEPAGWSMSLTPQGLSIHAVTRNFNEFNDFIKTISHQVLRDFGSEYLPPLWDPDAYFEQESDTEELEEDVYLVTVPVFCTRSLLSPQNSPSIPSFIINSLPIQQSFPHIIHHLLQSYKSIQHNTTVSHHLVQLMLQIQDYLNLSYDTRDELSYICVLTAYIISMSYFSTPTTLENNPIPLHDYIAYTKMIYLDYILRVDEISSYQLILCSTLLAWVDHSFISIAIRLLCNSTIKINETPWQLLIASLTYLDIQSSTFQFKYRQFYGKEVKHIWKSATNQCRQSKMQRVQMVMILEAKLMCLLHRVITLFYQVEQQQMKVHKIDVDEVLTLVRDMELWEQELPDWAKWNAITKRNQTPQFLAHMHMIYNMVKILLFRPFSITVDENQEEQTLTKTTFLDMSIQAADKLTTCLTHISYNHIDHWTQSACNLVNDVSKRVTKTFDKDEEIVEHLENIQSRLQIKKEVL